MANIPPNITPVADMLKKKKAAKNLNSRENGMLTGLTRAERATSTNSMIGSQADHLRCHSGDIYNNSIANSFVGGEGNTNNMYNDGLDHGDDAQVAQDENTTEPDPLLDAAVNDSHGAKFTRPGAHIGDVYNGKITKSAVGGRRNTNTIHNSEGAK
ncbi:hypothetical protein BDQ12DRAFT_726287 [Crucibulum laeve]|uniref:Uncharacterized protein n=1 Tax=Crucibulum laeve TaxID=68775 RepID=A0A5C3LQZ5_9AGAR|nr:hypothetical protein BDQ12DRAFT_726287 [Crucibulum laeve]